MSSPILVQAEVTFGGCQGGCGIGENRCIVRNLRNNNLTSIPTLMRGSLEALHALAKRTTGTVDETLSITSTLGESASILGDVVNIYDGTLKMLCLGVGDTSEDQLSKFSDSISGLQKKLTHNRQLSLVFGHGGEETEESIFAECDRALRYLLANGGKIPERSMLGVGLSRNNSQKTDLWLRCYNKLLDTFTDKETTSNPKLNDTIAQLKKGVSIQVSGAVQMKEGTYRGGFNHMIELTTLDRIFSVAIQVMPAIDSLQRATPFRRQITPLIAPGFVFPFHNVYAMNKERRIDHVLFQETLNKIIFSNNLVDAYNQTFLEILR